MRVKLIVVGGKASRTVIALKLPTVIGRSREAQLTVAHPMISRRHCEVYESDGLLMIRDLGSLNGTLVDSQRIREAPLPPKGEFTVGPLTFQARYEYSGDLDSLPAVQVADENTQSGGGGSDTTESDEQLSKPNSLDDTPSFVSTDPAADQPASDVLPDFSDWEQMAADAVTQVEEEDEPEPTPPPTPADDQSKDPDSGKSPSVGSGDDELNDFLKGLQ